MADNRKIFNSSKPKQKHSLRDIWDAIFYLLRTGCQWRMLPEYYPKWKLVYYYYSNWRDTGLFEHINTMLREKARELVGKTLNAQ